MRKSYVYIILAVFEIALALSYGFILQNAVPLVFCVMVAFTTPIFVLHLCSKERRNISAKWKELLTASLLLMSVFSTVFFGINELHGEFIGEYDVIVEYVNGRGGGYAEFTTPQGRAGSVDLNDYRILIIDDSVEIGDTIRVREYKGFFNKYYYRFVEEKH